MGIRINCPTCNKRLNVKSFLAGKRGVCPDCDTRFEIPAGAEHNVVVKVEQSEATAILNRPREAVSPARASSATAVAAPIQGGVDTASWHVCSAAGEKYGPVSGETFRQWIAERRVLPDSLVWREGWAEWQRADVVFAELASVPPVPAAIPIAKTPAVIDPFPRERSRVSISRSYGRRSQNTRLLITILLILCVLVLAPLLGYVLVQQL